MNTIFNKLNSECEIIMMAKLPVCGLVLSFLGLLIPVHAQEGIHPWLISAPRFIKETYFSNLADGASIETPFILKFGLTGMGLAAIDKSIPKTGHHHLLVNRGLPTDFSKPLPFNDQYRHFGAGQMEGVLDFQPGQYSLQLLLADHKHVPNFVASNKIKITVTKRNEAIDPKNLPTQGIAILSPQPNELLTKPFRMMMHASGLNVSSSALTKKNVGHFRIKIKSSTDDEQIIDLSNGYTEAWLSPPAGSYRAYIEFLDNNAPGTVLFKSDTVSFKVKN